MSGLSPNNVALEEGDWIGAEENCPESTLPDWLNDQVPNSVYLRSGVRSSVNLSCGDSLLLT